MLPYAPLLAVLGVAEVTDPTATSGSGKAVLVWTLPVGSSSVVVVRALAVPNTAPVNGQTYGVGSTLGNGVVRFAGTETTFTDSGLANGTCPGEY